MKKEAKKKGEFITYIGNCDVIRLKNFRWAEFKNGELIEGNKYEVKGGHLAQSVFKKENDKIVRDDSGERYLYYIINNEKQEEIYVWEGFFEENINL
jgi:hypothetical protein